MAKVKQIINVNIDVLKIDQKRLFIGDKGTYLDAKVLLFEEKDQYGNDGMVVEQITEDERKAGNKGTILGKAKIFERQSQGTADIAFPSAAAGDPVSAATAKAAEDLPF
jgi:hypothetical protein